MMLDGKSAAAGKTEDFAIESFDGGGSGKATSIGAVRRGRVGRPANGLPAGVDMVRRTPDTDDDGDLEAITAAVREMRQADLNTALVDRLGRIETKLEAVADSANFTEAYVSVELTRKIAEALDAQLTAMRAETRARRRKWTIAFFLIAAFALVLLGAEMHSDRVTHAIDVAEVLGGELYRQ